MKRLHKAKLCFGPLMAELSQETIYLCDSVVLSRSLMAQWMGHLGFELKVLADYILEKIKAAERVFADETTLPTLMPGSGKTMTAWQWAYARDYVQLVIMRRLLRQEALRVGFSDDFRLATCA